MKKKIAVACLLSLSVLIFTCTVRKDSKEAVTEPQFNPHPTAEYLSPQQSIKTMYLPKGYHMQLVASEPMISEPVAIAWDGNARMYVAEMNTYMQDADGSHEQERTSRIKLLEDINNDGVMDKSTIFIDGLLLPRMIQCVNHELLVNETNTQNIYSYSDTNGDGKADVKKPLYIKDKENITTNMEHQRSGLDWNLDNWMYLTYDPVRFRYTNGVLKTEELSSGYGQWGVTHDNYGRIFYSAAGSEIPVRTFQINPAYGSLEFADQYSDEFVQVWPIIATPDVQGGLVRLRPDVTLNHFTASCGQSIYRGGKFPADADGDYFIAEPVARIVRRADVITTNGKTRLENAYNRREFLSSSDMNFRPVNTATGPDGNLYIVDMYRGIIQQANWTQKGSFLRGRIDSLGLAKNVGRGRIYRVVYDGYKKSPKPNMLNEPAGRLVPYLDHPNGWWRDNAQKQLIALGDRSVVAGLKQIALGKQGPLPKIPGHLARIHALWTLEGLEAVDKDVLVTALKDEHPQVRKTALWISERFIKSGDEEMIAKAGHLLNDPSYDVRVQLLLSLYSSKSPAAKSLVKTLVSMNPDNEMLQATKTALDKNEDVKNFGSRLGNLAATDRDVILKGASIFKSLCSSCHGPDGKGMVSSGTEMPAPPLVNSKRLVFAEKNNAIRILLHGLTGPIDGKKYPSLMPSQGINSDEWIAAVLSYARYQFGGALPQVSDTKAGGFAIRRQLSPVVTTDDIKNIRQETAGRVIPWTTAEIIEKSKEDASKATVQK